MKFTLKSNPVRNEYVQRAGFFAFGAVFITLRLEWSQFIQGDPSIRLAGLLGAYFFYRSIHAFLIARRSVQLTVTVDEAGVILPGAVARRVGVIQISWDRLRLATAFGSRGGPTLLLADDADVYALHSREFEEPDAFPIMVSRVGSFVASDPSRHQRCRRSMAAFRQAQQRLAVRPVGTWGLLAVTFAVFVCQLANGAVRWDALVDVDVEGIIRLGASFEPFVNAGDYGRWFTAVFLHGGWAHLLMNGLGLFFVGSLLEGAMGWTRTLLCFLLSAVVASVCSTYFSAAMLSVGASGGVFGLLGGVIFLQLRVPSLMPYSMQLPGRARRVWFGLLAANGLIALLIPQIDHVAHMTGMCAGFLCLALFGRKRLTLRASPRLFEQVATVMLLGAFLAFGLQRIATYDDELDLSGVILERVSPDDEARRILINGVAWDHATMPDRSDLSVRAALSAMERVVSVDPNLHFQDTLAALYHRSGRREAAVDRALAIWRAVREGDASAEGLTDVFCASQVLRFMLGLTLDERLTKLSVERTSDGVSFKYDSEPDPAIKRDVFMAIYRDGIVRGLLLADATVLKEREPMVGQAIDVLEAGRYQGLILAAGTDAPIELDKEIRFFPLSPDVRAHQPPIPELGRPTAD